MPEALPESFTFRKVRELLVELENREQGRLDEAIKAIKGLKIHGPLAALIFIKHHLDGGHEVEIDRIEESEDGIQYAVLIYAEGEVPLRVEWLPKNVSEGVHVRYDPVEARYRAN